MIGEIGSETRDDLIRDMRCAGIASSDYDELVPKRGKYIRPEELHIPDRWDLCTVCAQKYQLEHALGCWEIQKMVTTLDSNGVRLHGAYPGYPRTR